MKPAGAPGTGKAKKAAAKRLAAATAAPTGPASKCVVAAVLFLLDAVPPASVLPSCLTWFVASDATASSAQVRDHDAAASGCYADGEVGASLTRPSRGPAAACAS